MQGPSSVTGLSRYSFSSTAPSTKANGVPGNRHETLSSRAVFMTEAAQWAKENNCPEMVEELGRAYDSEQTFLSIRGKHITTFPPLPSTVKIVMWGTNEVMKELPPVPQQVTSLTLGTFSKLTTLQGDLSNLTDLDIKCCEAFSVLPAGCSALTNLRMVDLPKLTTLPKDLHKLTTLEIDRCTNFNQLPNSMPLLTHLDLHGCSGLTVSLEKFPQLTYLDIRGVQNIIQPPPSLNKLRTLKAEPLISDFFQEVREINNSQESWYAIGKRKGLTEKGLICFQNALSLGHHEGAYKQLRLHSAEIRNADEVFVEACAYKDSDSHFATQLFEIAYIKGSLSAARELGKIYQSEGGSAKEIEECFKQAADGGDSDGAYELAMLYQSWYEASSFRMPWEKDFEVESRKYLTMAADKGHPEAAYKLGLFYKHEMEKLWSIGSKDKAMAQHYLGIASKQGHKAARQELSMFTDEPISVAKPKYKNYDEDGL